MRREIDTVIAELEDCAVELADMIAHVHVIEDSLPNGRLRMDLRQVRAQLEMTASADHQWLGGMASTLNGVIISAEISD